MIPRVVADFAGTSLLHGMLPIAMVGSVSIHLPAREDVKAEPGDYIVAGFDFQETQAVKHSEMASNWMLFVRIVGIALQPSVFSVNEDGQPTNVVTAYIHYQDSGTIVAEIQKEFSEVREEITESKAARKRLASMEQVWFFCFSCLFCFFFHKTVFF